MDVEALAHGGASYRSVDDACMLVVERSVDPASRSHNSRLDLHRRNRRLRANNCGSLETDYGCARTKNEIMSPQIALHDPVFRAYLWIVPFSLIVSGALLALLNWARDELQRMSLAIVGFVYIGWMFGHLGFLANTSNAYGFICYIVFATELNDVAAFTFGRLFGRHPLRSKISPSKTWEGALGALAVSMLLPWLFRFSFPFFGAWQLILTGLIVGIGGQLGDLSISVIKRDIGTKDMGATIPGHGGILDRIDSLIYVAPLFVHMANYYYRLR